MNLFAHLIGFATLASTPHASGDQAASMYRYPDISRNEIVFVYANDLWRVPLNGGTALPLASPPGVELMPRFSPDGSEVAFVGNYDGGRDLYIVPTDGGMPQRVTHHPTTEMLSEWTTDGDLLFTASGMGGVPRAERPYRVNAEGGLPEALPVPYGANSTIDRTGTWLAYTPLQRDRRTWKRYQGGMASDIWLMNLETGESRQVTDWDGTDTMPMWHGDTLYYLSDAGPEHRLNIWQYDVANDTHKQVTDFSDYDVKWPAIGPDNNDPAKIVFQLGPSLRVLDPRSGRSKAVNITIPGSGASIRPQMVDASDFIQSWDVSPTGKRALAEARGDIWSLPAKKGSPRNLTRTSGAAERLPSWSPDGRWIAYFSDEPGEYELFVRPSDGSGEARRLTDDLGSYKLGITWAPNSEDILFADKTGTAYLVNVESGERSKIGKNPWGTFPKPSFSHDSRWITWAAGDDNSSSGRIHIYDTSTGETHMVTDSMFNDNAPAFDRKGEWLYFTSNRNFNPSYSELDTTWIYNNSGVLMAVPLRGDIDYPWLEESDEEEWTDEEPEEEDSEDEEESEDGEDTDAIDPDDPVTGTWECTAEVPQMGEVQMTVTLVLNDDDLVTGTLSSDVFTGELNGVWNAEDSSLEMVLMIPGGPAVTMNLTINGDSLEGTAQPEGMPDGAMITGQRAVENDDDDDAEGEEGDEDGEEEEAEDEGFEIDLDGFEQRAMKLPVGVGGFRNLAVNHRNQLMYVRSGGNGGIKVFDISDDSPSEKSAGGGGSFIMSGNGKKIMVPMGGGAMIRDAGPGGGGNRVVTDPMLTNIVPREEWRQLVKDAWRIQRDWFYDPGLHGVDWDATLEAYLPLVDQASTREDISYLIGEMIGELNVGHAYYWGGDGEQSPSMNVGMLGIDWEIDEGDDDTPAAYRVGEIIEGGVWDADSRNPLNRKGVELGEGDYVLAVNDVPMDTSRSPWAAFVGMAGKPVVLTVADSPDAEETRKVVVKTLNNESNLRYRHWIEGRRRHVEESTDGKVGYIYVPNTGRDGQSDLVRQFYGQAHKPALIVDERWNGGGQIPTRFIELMNRPVTNYWARRDSKDWKWPPDSHQGPKAMLINGKAGSGGDMFPWLFKHNNLGPVIGTRTWGGLVGISGNPTLIDGGYTAVPTFGFYETDGTWGIEGHGVEPDVEVIDDPALMRDGGDPQLDKAIEMMLEALENGEGYEPPARPDSPDRSGMGITEEDK